MNTDSPNEPWADQRVTAYVLGELDPTETAAFEQQLEHDPALATAVQEAKGITKQLKSWFAAETPLTLDADHRDGILEAIAQRPEDGAAAASPAAATPPSLSGRSHGAAARWMALAATVVLAVGAIGYQLTARYQADRRERVLALVESSRSEATAAASGQATAETAPVEVLSKQIADDAFNQRDSGDEAELFSRSASQQLSQPAISRFNGEAAEAEMPAARSENLDFYAEAAPPEANRPRLEFGTPMRADDAVLAGGMGGAAGLADQQALSSPRGRTQAAIEEPQLRSAAPAAEPLSITMDSAPPSGEAIDGIAANAPVERPEAAQLGLQRQASSDLYGSSSMGYGIALEERMGRAPTTIAGEPRFLKPSDSEASVDREAAPVAPLSPEVASVRGLSLSDQERRPDEGRGPGMAGDRFDPIVENAFKRVGEHPLSTFSIDVDTAAYSKVRQFLIDSGRLPRPDVVRIEELVNYFDYDYPGPPADSPHPLAAEIEIAQCPWNTDHRLARIAVQARRVAEHERPASNLVFLIDTSGSMNMPNRLPLVKQGLELLLDRLQPTDRVAVVVYAGSAGLVLDSTPASEVSQIRRALTRLQAGGSTNGGDGIRLAYQTARDHFIAGGINRVILCTDGDFNVGTTSQDELIQLVEQQARGGIDLTVLGFGMGNHNDAMLEQISGRGNGNYAFVDNQQEAQRVLVERATSTLFTVARDVKLQVEFNPGQVAAYRLIGYENRMLAKEDFKDDTKDAGEVGAGHSVTVLYELIPQDGSTDVLPPVVDELKYQRSLTNTEAAESDEVLTVKVRYKPISREGNAGGSNVESIPLEFPAKDSGQVFSQASESYRLAALVAAFGLQLRNSEHRGNWTLADVLREANALGGEPDPARAEWRDLVRRAAELQVTEPTAR